MRRIIMLLVLVQFSIIQYGQIIADHNAVDAFDNIPQEYLDIVKTMLVDISGESHSSAYRKGATLLEAMDNTYSAETYSNEAPPTSTDQYLRIGNHTTMGEDYFFSQSKIADLKSAITAQKNTGNPFDVMGFGWCWDMTWQNDPGGTEDPVYHVRWAGSSVGGPNGSMRWGLDIDDQSLTGNSVSMDTYLDAVESYAQHCTSNDIPTTWIFTTGPVDGNSGTENGFQRELKHDYIRAHVAEDDSRILFDYADILCWNNSGEQNLADWNDGGTARPHAQIHPDNMMDYDNSWNPISHSEDGDHIGEVGAVRLAKAMWWMLAKMAGWEEEISSVAPGGATVPEVSISLGSGYIRVGASEVFRGDVKLFDLTGRLVESTIMEGSNVEIPTSKLLAGVYVIMISKDNNRVSRKVLILE